MVHSREDNGTRYGVENYTQERRDISRIEEGNIPERGWNTPRGRMVHSRQKNGNLRTREWNSLDRRWNSQNRRKNSPDRRMENSRDADGTVKKVEGTAKGLMQKRGQSPKSILFVVSTAVYL